MLNELKSEAAGVNSRCSRESWNGGVDEWARVRERKSKSEKRERLSKNLVRLQNPLTQDQDTILSKVDNSQAKASAHQVDFTYCAKW